MIISTVFCAQLDPQIQTTAALVIVSVACAVMALPIFGLWWRTAGKMWRWCMTQSKLGESLLGRRV